MVNTKKPRKKSTSGQAARRLLKKGPKPRKVEYEVSPDNKYTMDYQPTFKTYKIMIGVPAIQDPPWWFVLAFMNIAHPVNFSKRTYVCWGREVGDARNLIVDQALNENCEFILFLDDDVIVPPNVFTQLYSHKKDIVSGLYTTKSIPSYPLVFGKPFEGCMNGWKLGDTVKAWGCGMGATLINTRVFTEGKIEKINPLIVR